MACFDCIYCRRRVVGCDMVVVGVGALSFSETSRSLWSIIS